MKLTELIKMFKEAREKATPGKAVVYRNDSSCGYFNFMVEIPEAKQNHIIAHYLEFDNPQSKQNAEFNMTCLNHILELTEKAEKMQKALEFYAIESPEFSCEISEYVGKGQILEGWKLIDTGNKARQVLAEVEEEK
jgi:hypothetical protein